MSCVRNKQNLLRSTLNYKQLASLIPFVRMHHSCVSRLQNCMKRSDEILTWNHIDCNDNYLLFCLLVFICAWLVSLWTCNLSNGFDGSFDNCNCFAYLYQVSNSSD